MVHRYQTNSQVASEVNVYIEKLIKFNSKYESYYQRFLFISYTPYPAPAHLKREKIKQNNIYLLQLLK